MVNEAEIVQRVLAGDKQAFGLIVREYEQQIYGLALRMTRDPEAARDLAQEAFIRAWSSLWRYDCNRKFANWLFTVAVNVVRNHLKKAARERQRLTSQTFETADENARDGPTSLREKEREQIVQDGIMKLPVKLREAVILRYYLDQSIDDVAATLKISLSAAKMRIYRGLDQLQAHLKEFREPF